MRIKAQLGCAKMEEQHRNAVQNLHSHTHRTIGQEKLGKNQAIYSKTYHCVYEHIEYLEKETWQYLSLTLI